MGLGGPLGLNHDKCDKTPMDKFTLKDAIAEYLHFSCSKGFRFEGC